jgi:hypothetical protein
LPNLTDFWDRVVSGQHDFINDQALPLVECIIPHSGNSEDSAGSIPWNVMSIDEPQD